MTKTDTIAPTVMRHELPLLRPNTVTKSFLPKIGCFEIHYLHWENGSPRRTLIFSKLLTRRWPKWDEIKVNLQSSVKHKDIKITLKGSKDSGLDTFDDLRDKTIKLVQNRKSGFNERIPKKIVGKFIASNFDQKWFEEPRSRETGVKIVIKKGDDKRVYYLADNEEQSFEFDCIDIREEFTVKVITQGHTIRWQFCSSQIPEKNTYPEFYRDFMLKDINPKFEMAVVEFSFENV